MRRALILCAALAAWFAAVAPAAAQDEIIRELQRKARAGEKDDGWCASAAERIPRFEQGQVRTRLNELLSHEYAEGASILFVTGEPAPLPPMCYYIAFRPVVMKGGKRCRDSAMFRCVSGKECAFKADQPICEVRTGVWD